MKLKFSVHQVDSANGLFCVSNGGSVPDRRDLRPAFQFRLLS